MRQKLISRSAFLSVRVLIALLLCASVCFIVAGRAPAFLSPEGRTKLPQRNLTFAERLKYQRAIEEVYWRHRIWPKENPSPKPSLDAVISQAQLKRKVEKYLSESQSVAEERRRPITGCELQAEMDRMASHTKQPVVLRELFEALDSNPLVIAECLARPILAERLIANRANSRYPTIAEGDRLFPTPDLAWPLHGEQALVPPYESDITVVTNENATYKLPEIADSAACIDDAWSGTDTANAPDMRARHSAIWTGNEMIVWGGYNTDGGQLNTLNSGSAYNPAEDTWTALSIANAPVGRALHTVVWTGSEMIVWGGYNYPAGDLNTGGRYNPMQDTWTVTGIANAPAPRESHTAVWTGSEMLIWGGNFNGGAFNTGGRYNPNSDSWVATSTTNAAQARWSHTAVWTGNEMIVWGGTDQTNYLQTGGRYDPNAGSWTATSIPNDVLGRAVHTAIWTGSEMIVWGGVDSTFNDCNTGGRYDPGTNSWIASNIINAPSPRDSHTAVWTGDEMIVWGGAFCCPGMDFNDGGRYDVAADQWTATSTADAPHERDSHTAVWTGDQMIVWGGGYFSGGNFIPLDSGGKYCVQSSPSPTATPTVTMTPAPTPTASPSATPSSPPRVRPTVTRGGRMITERRATPSSPPRVRPTPRSRPTPAPRP